MKIRSTTLRSLLGIAVVGLLLTSCASEAVKAQAKKEKEEKDKYVDYYPTGSNIPVKIPKEDAKTSTAQTDATQEEMRRAQRQFSHPESGPQSGIPGAPGDGGPR